jgi:uncharacterized protein YgiM (DUF1202 family)
VRARRLLVVASLAVLLASGAAAETATTKDRTRFRQGPSAATELLGELDPNTKLELLGESAGWRQVRTPDGRVGWVWGEHLAGPAAAPAAGPAAGPGAAPRPPAPATPTTLPPRTMGDELRELRDQVSALRERPEPATAADLERIRQELERLSAVERDLVHRLDDRPVPTPLPDPPTDGAMTFAPALLFIGALVGYAGSRLVQRRRDGRQRNRLRL